MDVGELIVVRLEETGTTRFLLPGLIVDISDDPKQNRKVYTVLSRGETYRVTDSDLGPLELLLSKEELERKWNEDV